MDRNDLSGLVGRKVAVRLNSVEARGVEIVATLEEVRGAGIVLSEIGELGPGPTLLCPWESLHQVRDRPPWLAPPHEEPEEGQVREFYQLREVVEDDVASETPPPERRNPSARTLERVVPVAQKMEVAGITVAIASLELYGEGLGVLRWRITFGDEALRAYPDLGFDTPEPVLEIRDGSGRTLDWLPQGAGYSDSEADGDLRVAGLPDSGELDVEVTRLVSDAYEPGEHRGDGPSYEGPWSFRVTL